MEDFVKIVDSKSTQFILLETLAAGACSCCKVRLHKAPSTDGGVTVDEVMKESPRVCNEIVSASSILALDERDTGATLSEMQNT